MKAGALRKRSMVFRGGSPPGKEANWIQTVPGKGWFTILRLYGPLNPWFDKTWRPGEIEAIEQTAGHRRIRVAPTTFRGLSPCPT